MRWSCLASVGLIVVLGGAASAEEEPSETGVNAGMADANYGADRFAPRDPGLRWRGWWPPQYGWSDRDWSWRNRSWQRPRPVRPYWYDRYGWRRAPAQQRGFGWRDRTYRPYDRWSGYPNEYVPPRTFRPWRRDADGWPRYGYADWSGRRW